MTPNPAEPTISRRGLFAFAGAGAGVLLVANVGQSIGGPLRKLAFLAPRREIVPGDFPINKTARAARVTEAMTGDGYLLKLRVGDREVAFSREELLALPAAHGDAADRVRGGLDDRAGVDRRAAEAAGRARGRAGRERGPRRVAAARGRAASGRR